MTPNRLLELALFAPIGAAAVVRERVEQRVTVARFIGQMVVQQGRREIEKRLATPDPVTDTPPAPPDPPGQPRGDVIASQAPPAADLPIDEYESLAAGQVVARLAALDAEGLAAIEAFESANRNRRTVLNRIAQLRDRS